MAALQTKPKTFGVQDEFPKEQPKEVKPAGVVANAKVVFHGTVQPSRPVHGGMNVVYWLDKPNGGMSWFPCTIVRFDDLPQSDGTILRRVNLGRNDPGHKDQVHTHCPYSDVPRSRHWTFLEAQGG